MEDEGVYFCLSTSRLKKIHIPLPPFFHPLLCLKTKEWHNLVSQSLSYLLERQSTIHPFDSDSIQSLILWHRKLEVLQFILFFHVVFLFLLLETT